MWYTEYFANNNWIHYKLRIHFNRISEQPGITDPENHKMIDFGSGDLNRDTENNFDISSAGLHPGALMA